MIDSARFDVSTGGELLGVLSASTTGPLESVDSFVKGIGGAEVNVAIGLARLGLKVTWWGAVGDDPIGRQGLATMRRAGVDTSSALVDRRHPTGVYLKERPDPTTAIAHYYRTGSAAAHLRTGDLDVDSLLDCRVLHVTGITAALPGGRELLQPLMADARRRGALVSLDINARPLLLAGRSAADVIGPLAAIADVVLATPDEAVAVFGDDEPDVIAARCGELALTWVVIHHAESATVVDETGIVAVRPAHSGAIVDPVGAGDAFATGFLAALVRRRSPAEALELAHTCASRQVAVLGDNAFEMTTPPADAVTGGSQLIGSVGRTNAAKGLG